MKTTPFVRRLLALPLALLAIFCCYRFSAQSARNGRARLDSTYSIITSSLEPVDEAVAINPDDPEAHYTRALTLVNLNRLQESVDELREAIRLRPHHYYEWLDLGVTLDRLDDRDGAVAAIRESVRLAPSFAQPHWQLGNLFYRQERYDEAFAELRFGASKNPALADPLFDLAWAASNGEAAVMEKMVQPDNPTMHLELAQYFAKHGNGQEAVSHVTAAATVTDEVSRGRLQQIVLALLANGKFADAYAAWELSHASLSKGGRGTVLNGDFTQPIPQVDPGFGWQLNPLANVQVSIDSAGPPSGGRSISFEFSGEYPPATPLLSQIILVEPNTHYALTYATRSERLVTGGPPILTVSSLGEGTKILATSGALPIGDGPWTEGKLEFSTERQNAAIIILVQRLGCNQTACPVFGRLWLGNLGLSKR